MAKTNKEEFEDKEDFDHSGEETKSTMDFDDEEEEPKAKVYTATEVRETYQEQLEKIQSKLNALDFAETKDKLLEELPAWKLSMEKVVASHGDTIKLIYTKLQELNAEFTKPTKKKK